DVFAGLVHVQRASLCNSFEQGGLTGKLMLQLLVRNHSPGVRSCRFAQTFFHAQWRHAGEFAALVGRLQKFVLGGGVLASGGPRRRVRGWGGLFWGGVVSVFA